MSNLSFHGTHHDSPQVDPRETADQGPGERCPAASIQFPLPWACTSSTDAGAPRCRPRRPERCWGRRSPASSRSCASSRPAGSEGPGNRCGAGSLFLSGDQRSVGSSIVSSSLGEAAPDGVAWPGARSPMDAPGPSSAAALVPTLRHRPCRNGGPSRVKFSMHDSVEVL